jgi:hypothetical protein
MPEEASETYKDVYQQRHESSLGTGILTNLYLMNGADVRKAATDADTLAPLMNYWLSKRYHCLPPGIPHWFFPGMGLESSSGKDIANQPALNYGRIIADLRSLAGEQVKWALSIELVLAKGFDWFQENGGFDIAWPKWFVTGQEADIMQEEEDAGEKIQSGRGTGKTKVDDSSTSTSASHKRRY